MNIKPVIAAIAIFSVVAFLAEVVGSAYLAIYIMGLPLIVALWVFWYVPASRPHIKAILVKAAVQAKRTLEV